MNCGVRPAFPPANIHPDCSFMRMQFFMTQWRSLKTRVTLFTLAMFVAGIWAMAFYASQTLRTDMQRLLGEQQFSTVSFIAARVNRELADRLHALEKIAATISPGKYSPEAVQNTMALLPLFQSMFNGGNFVTGMDGIVSASTLVSAYRPGMDLMDRDYIRAALMEGKATIGRPVMDEALGVPVVKMAVPIRDAQGNVVGALAGAAKLGMAGFLEGISDGSYGKSGVFLLAAPRHNLFVTSSDPSRIMRALPAPGLKPLHDRFMAGYEGYGTLENLRAQEVLVAAKGIPVAGWFMAIELPTVQAFAPIRAMQQRMLLAAILLTLLVAGLTWWMLRRQLSPMLAAVETLANLSAAQDEPLHALPITTQDEIGQMIGGFNRLLETLGQRKQALRESEFRWKFAIEGAGDGLWDLDVVNNTAYFSTSWKQMLGFAEDEISNSPREWIDRIHPDDRTKTLGVLHGYMDGEISEFVSEHRLRCKDGSYRWIHDRGTVASRSADGKPLRLIGTHRDISARKEADDLLHKQRTQIKLAAQVFAQASEGIMISDAQGNIHVVNKAFTAMTGYSEAELLGKNTRSLSSGLNGPAFYRAMWEGIKSHDSWSGEISDRRKNGTELSAWLAISTMRDEQSKITHYVSNFTDLSDAKASQVQIQRLSQFDSLTGLPNRALLVDRTTQSISVAQRAGETLTMMAVSIDHFDVVSDAEGYRVGERLLVEMARRLGEAVREQDTVARVSGRKFILVLPDTNSDGAALLASELLWKLSRPCGFGDHQLSVTASIGIASYPDNGSDFDALFKAVESATHRAQALGHNGFQFYNEAMYQQVQARECLLRALRQAVARDQLHLHYQPQVDLTSGQVSGMEALLRWQHPELGAVAPDQFIPLAEEANLINGIGEWVIRRVCRDMRCWLDKGIKVPPVAINVSPLQFRDPGLIRQVTSALSHYRIDPALICIEVTEGALMDDVPGSEAMLKGLRAAGVKLALDDFGTGYSSLSYLKRFPFDKLKIDQSFVRDLTTSQSDSVLVRVMVAMAHGLGMCVVAEGVETEAQCATLLPSGCDEIQGYLFSRPVPAPAIEDILTGSRQLARHLRRAQKPQSALLMVSGEPDVVGAV